MEAWYHRWQTFLQSTPGVGLAIYLRSTLMSKLTMINRYPETGIPIAIGRQPFRTLKKNKICNVIASCGPMMRSIS
jgi:hypothetical protein